jgi:hypothetical protein
MNNIPLSRRRFVSGTLAIGATSLSACGGGDDPSADGATANASAAQGPAAEASASANSAASLAVQDGSNVTAAAASKADKQALPAVYAGTSVSTLKANAAQTGMYPYAATVLPLPGQVPAALTLVSPDDATMSASVLSRWADGSASVMVVAGNIAVNTLAEQTLRLVAGVAPIPTAKVGGRVMNPDQLARLVQSVKLDFGSLGVATLNNLSKPERIWWANAQTICARYRVAAPGHATLEAVIDVQAFLSGRALVEVVVENAKLSSSAPVKPAAASYAAVVTVNGSLVANTVQSSAGPEATHTAFRAWYAALWVGGDPGLRVTQAAADLQLHPLLFKCDKASTFDMQTYAADTYKPWGTGRQRQTYMGTGGDHDSIGPLPKWEAHFLQSGDPRAANAVEASALAVLGYNINYRNSSTGQVPNFSELVGRSMQSNWPYQINSAEAMTWEVAHHPAAGLMAFVCRPSPVFIEMAQKIATWNGLWSTWSDGAPTATGVFGRPYQVRGRAWGMRSLGHAMFLTPDGDPWKAAAATSIENNVAHLDQWRTSSKAVLNAVWDETPNTLGAQYSMGGASALGTAMWQHYYLVTELHKVASAGLLRGASQAALDRLADWTATQAVRWVNEQPKGGWRYVPYVTPTGRNKITMDSLPDWGQQMDWWFTDPVPAVSGPWLSTGSEGANTHAAYVVDATAGAYYPSYLWSALVVAVDRGLTGSVQAWQTVNSNVSNLDNWRNGFAKDPRWGVAPKRDVAATANQPPAPLPQPVGNAGSFANDVWTPGRDSAGLVTQASWALVPSGRWATVAGTRLDSLDAVVKNAVPGWRDYGSSSWAGVTDAWSGFAVDTAGSRLWIMGGGHSNSTNNGVYRFDALRMQWDVESLPSDPTGWSAAYKSSNNFSRNGDSDAQFIASNAAGTLKPVNDWYADELPGDRKPTSRHTYSGMVFVPDTNELVVNYLRLWRFSLTTKSWVYKRLIRDLAVPLDSTTQAPYMDREGMIGIYDEASKEFLASSAGSWGLYRATGYNMAQNQWTNWTSPWNRYFDAADTRHGRRVVVVKPPNRKTTGSGWAGLYWDYDLDKRSVTASGQLQYADGLTQDSFANEDWYYDGAALTYVPSRNTFWLFTLMATGAMALLEIDPTTPGGWTVRRAPNMVGKVPVPNSILKRKMIYLPALNAVILCATATQDMYLYKL